MRKISDESELSHLAELMRLEILLGKMVEIGIRRGVGQQLPIDVGDLVALQEAVIAYSLLQKLVFVARGDEFLGLSNVALVQMRDALRRWLELTIQNLGGGHQSAGTWTGPQDAELITLANGIGGYLYVGNLVSELQREHGIRP